MWWLETRQLVPPNLHEAHEPPLNQALHGARLLAAALMHHPLQSLFAYTFHWYRVIILSNQYRLSLPAAHRRGGWSAGLAALIQQAITPDVVNDICQVK
jgi:hypothetical protein